MSEFCPTCEDYREAKTVDRNETYTVRGTQITVPVKLNVCSTCGEDLSPDERDKEVVDLVRAEYRRQNDLLTPERIKTIRKRHWLSQRSFASLLGMSEATINRYENGGLQDQVHDNAIRACEEPEYVRRLLQRRGHLLTEWQRKRVENALRGDSEKEPAWVDLIWWPDAGPAPTEVSDRTGFRRFDRDRFAGVVLWFCRELQDVSRTIINKLLFYADFLNYRTATVSLTGTAYRRVQYGPVPTHYDELLEWMVNRDLLDCEEVSYPEGYIGYHYRPGSEANLLSVDFYEHERRVLNRVAEEFRGSTAKAISERSHKEAAWQDTEDKQLISYEKAGKLSLDLAAS